MIGRSLFALIFLGHSAFAQTVLLQIRPHIGDTLRMHLSQSVEMTGTTPDHACDSTSMTTSVEVFTRAIAEQWTSGGTLMQTITDSVKATPASATGLDGLRRRALQAIFGGMPAMLARQPVRVGEKWTREMQIPLSGEPGAMGLVKATFRLDSLGRNGDLAFVSLHGTMSRADASRAAPP